MEKLELLPSPSNPQNREVAAAQGISRGATDTFSFLSCFLWQDLSSRNLTQLPTPCGEDGAVLLPHSPAPQNHPFLKVYRDVHTPKLPLPKGPERCPAAWGWHGTVSIPPCPAITRTLTGEAVVHQLQVPLHGGEDLVASAVDQHAGR